MNRPIRLAVCLLPFWLSACDDRDFETALPDDPLVPQVLSTLPRDQWTDVDLDSTISASFDRTMASATITADSFRLEASRITTRPFGSNNIVSVNEDGTVATLTPSAPFASGNRYRVTLDKTIKDADGYALKIQSWTFEAVGIDAPPTVSSTSPVNGALGVPIGDALSVTFSEPIRSSSINSSTVTLHNGPTPVLGTVSLDETGTVATFAPASPLELGLTYTGTVTGPVVDDGGLVLATPYTWIFTTDIVDPPPAVTAMVPPFDAEQVSVDTSISVTFNKQMNAGTLNAETFTLNLRQSSLAFRLVTGAVSYDIPNKTATFTPESPLSFGFQYVGRISGVADTRGTGAADHIWSFKTALEVPAVLDFTPSSTAPDVSIDAALRVTFSMAMDVATVTNPVTFSLSRASTPVAGSVTYEAETAMLTFTPEAPLIPGESYTATIGTAAKGANGVALPTSFIRTFTTTPCDILPIELGDAASFALLANLAVSNEGNSVISGNVGAVSGIEGFPPGTQTTGTLEQGTTLATDARAALTAPFSDVETRPLCGLGTIAAELGGQTLRPGVYESLTDMSLGGTLTLDALGNADAVFIFQTGNFFTASGTSQVLLTNGARAANVFWQANAGATLAAGGNVAGTLMTNSITLGAGAVLDGRALARNGRIDLNTSLVSLP
jgi:ice-binding like protein/Big-like domain-containing protein